MLENGRRESGLESSEVERSRPSRLRFALAWLSGGASLCAACKGPPACWNLQTGTHIAIELVELYAPTSSYTYQSVTIPAAVPPIPVDSYPPCGSDFDFKVGETLHATISDVEDVNGDQQQCLQSSFVVDSPVRSSLTSSTEGGRGLLYVDGQTTENDTIVVDGCASHRRMALVALPGHSGMLEDPVPGSVPAVVLVRAAELPLADDGSCQTKAPVPSCADQFVVRVQQ